MVGKDFLKRQGKVIQFIAQSLNDALQEMSWYCEVIRKGSQVLQYLWPTVVYIDITALKYCILILILEDG